MNGGRIHATLGTALVATMCLLCSGAAPAQSGAGTEPFPRDPLEGRSLFESKRCLECHGISGSGPRIGSRLDEGGFGGSFLEFGAELWNHVPTMSAAFESNDLEWPSLTPGETEDLVNFLYFLDYLGRPGRAEEGRRLFRTKGCGRCHTAGEPSRGAGTDLGDLPQFASPLYVAQKIWNHGPAMLESMDRERIQPPRFDPGDLADISAFLRQESIAPTREPLLTSPGDPRQGRREFRAVGCARCHGEDARGGIGGPDLAQYDLRRSAEAIAGTMWNHALVMRDAMSARGIVWPELEVSQLADITAFLYYLRFPDPEGDPGRGAALFAGRSCGGCHDGSGAPDLSGGVAGDSAAALVAKLWSHAPRMKEAVLQGGADWPRLTAEDLRHIHAYLVTGGRGEGERAAVD